MSEVIVEPNKWLCKACLKRGTCFLPLCPSCGEWNTYVPVSAKKASEEDPEDSIGDEDDEDEEEEDEDPRPKGVRGSKVKFKRHQRIAFGIAGLDDVLGNPKGNLRGAVVGSCNAITGDPGVGKSTLILQACIRAANSGLLVYHGDSEEPKENIIDRVYRLGGTKRTLDNIIFNDEAEYIEHVLDDADEYAPDILVVNSSNNYYAHDLKGQPIDTECGNPLQLKRISKLVYQYAHGKNRHKKMVTTFVMYHVNADGDMAGPKAAAHAVDALFKLTKEEGFDVKGHPAYGNVWMASDANKNRFGNSRIKALFNMDDKEGILVPVRVE